MDKYLKIIDITENPDRYTEEELREILSDPETQSIFNTLCEAEDSLKPSPTLSEDEVDREWEIFCHSRSIPQKRDGHIFRLLHNKVAVAITIVATSIAALAIGISVKNRPASEIPAASMSVAENISDIAITGIESEGDTIFNRDSLSTARSNVIFENEPLHNILTHISKYYGLKFESRNPKAEKLRLYFNWNQEKSVDEIVNQINNFENINLSFSEGKITLK